MSERHRLTLPNGDALHLHLERFDAARFDLRSFAHAGIELPPAIAASVVKRQAEFFHGRLAARAALHEHGATALEIPIGRSREPVWPDGFVGSISHTDGLAGAIAGLRQRYTGLGLDIEQVAQGEAQAALRETALDAPEMDRLRSMASPLSLDERVTLVFSAKESLYKAVSGTVQRILGFDAARLQALDASRGVIVLTLAEPLHPALAPEGQTCRVGFQRLGGDTFVTVFQAGGACGPT